MELDITTFQQMIREMADNVPSAELNANLKRLTEMLLDGNPGDKVEMTFELPANPIRKLSFVLSDRDNVECALNDDKTMIPRQRFTDTLKYLAVQVVDRAKENPLKYLAEAAIDPKLLLIGTANVVAQALEQKELSQYLAANVERESLETSSKDIDGKAQQIDPKSILIIEEPWGPDTLSAYLRSNVEKEDLDQPAQKENPNFKTLIQESREKRISDLEKLEGIPNGNLTERVMAAQNKYVRDSKEEAERYIRNLRDSIKQEMGVVRNDNPGFDETPIFRADNLEWYAKWQNGEVDFYSKDKNDKTAKFEKVSDKTIIEHMGFGDVQLIKKGFREEREKYVDDRGERVNTHTEENNN